VLAESLGTDRVRSRHIDEADGTSAQDTSSGSGIKTGHIQDAAVTTAKLADGAVTDAKVGSISSSKISGLEAALEGKADQAALETGLALKADAEHGHFFGNLAVVATNGGEYPDPVSAMNDINEWCGTPPVTNPCMLIIMPGVFDIGTNSLFLASHVTVAGSGEGVTKISGSPQSSTTGVVNLDAHSELRDLTVEARNTPADALWNTAVYVGSSPARLTGVTALALGGGGTERSIAIQLRAETTLKEVTARSSGSTIHHTGILSWATQVNMDGVDLAVDGGLANYAMWLYSSGATVKIYTLRDVVVFAGGGHSNSMGIYAYQYSSGFPRPNSWLQYNRIARRSH